MGKCICGRALCDLCNKERAVAIMENKLNGNKLQICKTCYKEFFEKNEK
jgi:ribosome-binding protein aMBF1 (putative translation factor)